MAKRKNSNLTACYRHARWFLVFGIVVILLQTVISVQDVIPAQAGMHPNRSSLALKEDPRLRGDGRSHRNYPDTENSSRSYIPFLYAAAKREQLQATPLRMADQITLKTDSLFNESLVVMDKVIVIPKVFG
jgi:hypothetical protein